MTSGFDQLERELRRAEANLTPGRRPLVGAGSQRRVMSRMIASASVLIAVVIAVAALADLHPASPSAPRAGSEPATRHYAVGGWSIAFPGTLHLTVTTADRFPSQVTVSSFPVARFLAGRVRRGTVEKLGAPPFNAPLTRAGRFPADGVALILQPTRFVTMLGADSRFPVTLDSYRPTSTAAFFSSAATRNAGLPGARSRLIVAYSEPLTATVMIGRNAPASVEHELENVIESISFRAQPPGTQVGTGFLAGPATRYPIGSFTRIEAHFRNGAAQPVYIVHAPGCLTYGQSCGQAAPCTPTGSFYGIGGQYNTRRDHAPICAIKLDRPELDFYCGNLAVRWDRVGRVISRPANESDVGSVEGLNAKVTWAGQLLITEGFGPQQSRPAVHQLWPDWRQPNEPLSR